MIELIKDRTLFEAVRTEAMEAYITDTDTGAKRIDAQKLITLLSTLRLCVCMYLST